MPSSSNLSSRGNALAINPARIDFEIFQEASQNLYHPEDNPDGAFPLNVAENALSAPDINEQITAIVKGKEIPDWVLAYTALAGNPDVREAVAWFMEKYLCKCPISADNIALSAGASAIIEVSSFILGNPHDVVVIPAPSYPMYTKDLGIKSELERYDLQTHFDLNEIQAIAPVTTALLDETWSKLQSAGKCFKILLITSPDNPTGCVYNESELKQLAAWCIQHEVHMIVNEIYGLSLIDSTNDAPNVVEDHVSFASIMQQLRSDYLHLWYAFSKDFAMSGLRIGVVHSLNEAFLNGYANANVPHLVSNFSQWIIGELLKDTTFIDRYIIDNRSRISKSYELTLQALKKVGASFIPAQGSFFVWADLSQFLRDSTLESEQQLWLDIYRNTGVLLTPGEGFNHQKKGLFRIVFTAVPYAHLEVAMNRLVDYLAKRKH